MRLASAQPGEREAVADLDALDRLDAHHRRRQPRVEPLRLRRVRPEPGRHTCCAHLHHAADRVAVRARLVDSSVERLLVDHGTSHGDPDRREQRLRDRAGGDVHRGVPRAGALERVARIVEAVLERAREVGVPGLGSVTGFAPLPEASPSGGHGLIPHSQFAWSRLRTTSASGVPSVRPCRSPASTSTWSCSICWRGLRP